MQKERNIKKKKHHLLVLLLKADVLYTFNYLKAINSTIL